LAGKGSSLSFAANGSWKKRIEKMCEAKRVFEYVFRRYGIVALIN